VDPNLDKRLRAVIGANAAHHPGIIAEAVVADILGAFELTPREVRHRERRRNHGERVRRLVHAAFRMAEATPGFDPVPRLAGHLFKAFLFRAREGRPMSTYTRLFIDESRVYLPGLAAILQRLRAGRPEEDDLREGRRLSHSIKGMALYEEQPAIAELSGAMERGFERLLGDGGRPSLLAALEAAVPLLAAMVEEVEARGAPQEGAEAAVAALEAGL
jgi:hypothetical protein